MARGANQKLKLLYLKQFFEEHTDEEHPAKIDDPVLMRRDIAKSLNGFPRDLRHRGLLILAQRL